MKFLSGPLSFAYVCIRRLSTMVCIIIHTCNPCICMVNMPYHGDYRQMNERPCLQLTHAIGANFHLGKLSTSCIVKRSNICRQKLWCLLEILLHRKFSGCCKTRITDHGLRTTDHPKSRADHMTPHTLLVFVGSY